MNGQTGSVQNLVDATHKWIQQPFATTMDLTHWFLIVGVIVISAFLWSRVLAHME
jgi:hypothetical protein